MIRFRQAPLAVLSCLVLSAPSPCRAQSEGSAGAVLLGAALGAYSGAGLGLVGSLVPCDRSLAGRTCVRIVTGLGAAGGLVAGALVGHADEDELRRHARSSAYGALIGTAAGLVLRKAVRQYGWPDVLASTALGAAVGASAAGAGLGLAAGATTGLLLWQGLGAIDASEAVTLAVGGLAVGGLVGWAISTGGGAAPAAARVTIPVSVVF